VGRRVAADRKGAGEHVTHRRPLFSVVAFHQRPGGSEGLVYKVDVVFAGEARVLAADADLDLLEGAEDGGVVVAPSEERLPGVNCGRPSAVVLELARYRIWLVWHGALTSPRAW
jgi:hypothetical protein